MINFLRILKKGIINFERNGWLSTATVSIMLITLFVAGSLYVINDLAKVVTQDLQDTIDVSAYFKEDAPEDQILEARKLMLQNPNVKSVDYISKEEAFEIFKNKHKDDSAIIDSLQEISENPLFATLNIKADSMDNYPQIVSALENSQYNQYIREINYEKNKDSIARFSAIISFIKKSGLFTALILAVIVILVTFNTIRLTIYTHRQEIEIMKLVGGTNWFIRGPFIVEGILYGIFASVLAMFVLYIGISFISAKMTGFLPSSDLLSFYFSSFWTLFFLELALGVSLGVFSSFIAIRKYLDS